MSKKIYNSNYKIKKSTKKTLNIETHKQFSKKLVQNLPSRSGSDHHELHILFFI